MERGALAIAFVLALSGCAAIDAFSGGGEADDAAEVDAATPRPDGPDAAFLPCAFEPELGTIASVTGAVAFEEPGTISYQSHLNDDPDIMWVTLFANRGVFAPRGYGPGTFTIEGAEASLETCGVCALLRGDGATPVDNTHLYVARSGSVEVRDTTDRLSAILTDVSYRHVVIDESTFETTDHPDGCETHVASFAFDQAIP